MVGASGRFLIVSTVIRLEAKWESGDEMICNSCLGEWWSGRELCYSAKDPLEVCGRNIKWDQWARLFFLDQLWWCGDRRGVRYNLEVTSAIKIL